MHDSEIVELFWQRDEKAITALQEKYGSFCFYIANKILHNEQDASETVNDTYLNIWNSIPPHKPEVLSAFIGKIARNIALKKVRGKTAEKRGRGEVPLTLDELSECIPDSNTVEDEVSVKELAVTIDIFLRTLSDNERRVFIRRYWYLDSVADICKDFGFTQSKVKMMLLRTREKLKRKLEKEGVTL